jgi:hypothetical protein
MTPAFTPKRNKATAFPRDSFSETSYNIGEYVIGVINIFKSTIDIV